MANPISKLNLVINGVTTQLDVHDDNALTTEIDSMGTGWVRFKCGLQICWGEEGIAWTLQEKQITISFAKSFMGDNVTISLSHSRAGYTSDSFSQIYRVDSTKFEATYAAADSANPDGYLMWLAIGYWK